MEATMDYAYIRKGVEQNEDIYNWLLEDGITFKALTTKHFVSPTGGGAELVSVLEKKAKDAGAQIVCNTRAIKLLTDENGKVNGVVATTDAGEVTYTAGKGVVIATGSFSANLEMFAKYQRNAVNMGTNTASSNPAINVGDGIVMAAELGAKLHDMQFMGFIWRGYRGLGTTGEANTLGNVKQMAVNEEGKRFADDSASQLFFHEKPTVKAYDGYNESTNSKSSWFGTSETALRTRKAHPAFMKVMVYL